MHTTPSTLADPGCAVPSAAKRCGLWRPQQTELRTTTEVPKREPQWPCRHWPPLQDSCRGASQRTVAPASRQTLAKVLSGASAHVLSLPERWHAARWRPVLSNRIPHSNTFSITCKNNLDLSRIRVLKSPASMRNSSFEEHTLNASEAPGPECDRRWLGQRHTIGPTPRSSGKCIKS